MFDFSIIFFINIFFLLNRVCFNWNHLIQCIAPLSCSIYDRIKQKSRTNRTQIVYKELSQLFGLLFCIDAMWKKKENKITKAEKPKSRITQKCPTNSTIRKKNIENAYICMWNQIFWQLNSRNCWSPLVLHFFSFGFCLILMVATTTRIMQIYKRRQKGEKVFIIKAVLAEGLWTDHP